ADYTPADVLSGPAALARPRPPVPGAPAPPRPGPAPGAPPAAPPDAWRRPLALFLAGLRTAPVAGALPAPALSAAELGEVLRELGPHRTRAGDRETGA
ncbi:TetR/AcrR family transcriptional regulator, partial [Streptomyces tendae]